MKIARLLGYMTAADALACGFTNHGKYFGIPCWVGGIDGDFKCATKWAPMEYLMTCFHHIEGTLAPLVRPDCEPAFQFLVGPPIRPRSR